MKYPGCAAQSTSIRRFGGGHGCQWRDTFGSRLLEAMGITNICSELESNYPELDLSTVAELQPDLIIPSEPYEFDDAHLEEFADIAPAIRVDGRDLFWWECVLGGDASAARNSFSYVRNRPRWPNDFELLAGKTALSLVHHVESEKQLLRLLKPARTLPLTM